MINVQAVVLKLLLTCTDRDEALSCFDIIKPAFFDKSYTLIYRAITTYYNEHGYIPSIEGLMIKFSRNYNVQLALTILKNYVDLDIDIYMAIDELKNQYTQTEALNLLNDKFLKNVTSMSSEEVVETITSIATELEEKTDAVGQIAHATEISVFTRPEDFKMNMMYTGISNKLDCDFGGVARQEVIYLGGSMGSGKSVVCANVCVNQYYAGNIAPYYTIEMTMKETLIRMLAIMSGQNALSIKTQTIEGDALKKLALTRAKMFEGGAEVFQQYISAQAEPTVNDFIDMDEHLMANHEENHPLIIVDDPTLKLSKIDVSMAKFKSEYGDKFTMAVVDYVNRITLENTKMEQFDWQYQLMLSNGLKDLARKHDCAVFSPYQMNDDGTARFSKSVLVPVDIALTLRADHEAGIITFDCSPPGKIRSAPPTAFSSAIDWSCLKIDPREVTPEEADAYREEAKSSQDYSQDDRGDYELD